MRLRHRIASAAAALLLLSLLGWRWSVSIGAADAETAWGAADPSWSPDGRQLVFSLFGSLWRVPAQGGAAVQITTSPGYHAHPAWSPKGDWVAFIRGNPPGGRIPNVGGSLVLVNVDTGEERELRTPFPTAGTPAWPPDASRVAIPLRESDSGAVLFEVRLVDGRVEKIQHLMQNLRGGAPWLDVSWSPEHDEIFYTAQSGGAPQVFSTRPAGPPLIVQLPLTRYKPADIALLQAVSALPDGSGAVYSADIVNGRGNYELYRVSREGGQPAALTETERDEFSPAVSPDGKRIAFVSNRPGNIDLFTMPAAGGAPAHVSLTELRFRRPAGEVKLRVLDELGQPAAARVYVRASDGRAYCPPGVPIFYYFLDPGRPRDGFFLSTGEDRFQAPAGPLELIVLKGIEYETAALTIDVPAGAAVDAVVRLRRWTNWADKGWYTGENHFHSNYNGSYYQSPRDALLWLMAEDLNAANMIVANSEGAFIHDKEFFRGAADPLSRPRNVLYYGQEYRNSFPLGHMAFLNIRKLVPPSFTSVIGSASSLDYPLNTMAAMEARKQGGLVSYVHPMGASRDVFDTMLGAKEIPIGAALGAVDSIDILPFGVGAYELWYRLLNCGFRISGGAGTDVFTNWRGINNIPGGSRQYVEVGPAMNWERWVERFREGRNFVTNGPLIAFSVNGTGMGREINLPAEGAASVRLAIEVSSRVPFDAVEWVRNGEVIGRRQFEPRTGAFRVEEDVPVTGSCWLAARVSGKPARGVSGAGGTPRAHSGVVWVKKRGAPVLVREDLELMLRWIDRLWLLLEERNNLGPEDNRKRARAMFDSARAVYREKLRSLR